MDDKNSNIGDRQYVSRLIYSVLTDKLSVREAILHYPKNKKDKSLVATYHALIHREADEDLRLRDIEYREEQDYYLEFLAETLGQGKPVPKNIIKEYEEFYKDNSIPYSDIFKSMLDKICKFLNV
jgi:hypothetical protein